MKGQFFVMATVIMIFTLMALIRYFYDFSDINLPKLKEISELNYIPYIKESLNSTVASYTGDCDKLQDDLNATKIFLEDEMIKRGINLTINYTVYCPPINFNFTIKTSNLYTETVFTTYVISPPPPPSEELYVDANDTSFNDWYTFGIQPFIDDSIYFITGGVINMKMGNFTFADSVGSGAIKSVKLSIETKYALMPTTTRFDVWLYNGVWHNVWTMDPNTASYTWKTIDITSYLDTWSKINNAEVMFNVSIGGAGCDIRRAKLVVEYTV
jgi:hypothetical protein